MICSPPSVWQARHSASSCSVGPAGAERGPRAAAAATVAKASAAAGASVLMDFHGAWPLAEQILGQISGAVPQMVEQAMDHRAYLERVNQSG